MLLTRVPREFLIDRCKQLGCYGECEFLDAIMAMMVNMPEHVQIQIKCNGELVTSTSTSNLGRKQGGLLNPLKSGSFKKQLHDLVAMKLPSMGPDIGRLITPQLIC